MPAATTMLAMWMTKSRQVWDVVWGEGGRACMVLCGGIPHDPGSRNRGARRLGHTI